MAARDGAHPALLGNVVEHNALELPGGAGYREGAQFPARCAEAGARSANRADLPHAPGPSGRRAMIAPASRRVGKYEIVSKLGRGGMADVYLAQDTALGCSGRAQADRTLRRCRHDGRHRRRAPRRGVAGAPGGQSIRAWRKVYDCGDADGYFFVAMEYIDGQDLAELMRRGPLAPEFAADVAIAVAQDAGERAQPAGGDRRQGYSRHGARRYQAEEHPHRCARRGARARFRHRQGALALAPADAQ